MLTQPLHQNQLSWDDLFELATEDTSKYLWAISEWEDPCEDYSGHHLLITALSSRNRSRIGIDFMNGGMPDEYAPYRDKLLNMRNEAETILNAQVVNECRQMEAVLNEAATRFNIMTDLLNTIRRTTDDGFFFNDMESVKDDLFNACHQFQTLFSDAAHAAEELTIDPLPTINSETFKVRFKETEQVFKNYFGYFHVLGTIWEQIRADEYYSDYWWTRLPKQDQIKESTVIESIWTDMQKVYQQSLKSMHHDCPMMEKVCAYALGELPLEQKREVREHIVKCGFCFETMADIRAAEAQIEDNDRIVAVLPKVYDAVKEKESPKPWSDIHPAIFKKNGRDKGPLGG